MKIGHVITRMIVGGAQENTLFTLRGHLDHGHDATLITGPTSGPEGKLLESQKVPNLRILEVPSLIRAMNPWRDWQALRALTGPVARPVPWTPVSRPRPGCTSK